MTQQKIFFPNLDALRFIAFLFVFFEHVVWGTFRDLNIQDPLLKHVLYNLLCNGGVGVSVFFVLSGFLITYLILSEIRMNGKLDVKAFYVRRSLRIWPLYYAVLLFVFFIFPFFQHLLHIYQESCARPGYYFAFLSNFDLIHIARNCYDQGNTQSGVTWSVAIEEQFYFVWPLLFVILPEKLYKYCFVLVIAIALAFRIYFHTDIIFIYFHTLGVVCDLAAGALVAYYSLNSNRFILFFSSLKKPVIYAVYIFGISFILLGEYFFPGAYYSALSRFVNIAFFCFLIAHQNFTPGDTLKLGRLKFFTKWGKYTYGLYLLHPIATLIGNILFKRIYHGQDSFWISISENIGIFLLTSGLAYVSYHWFESYFLKLKNKFSYITKN